MKITKKFLIAITISLATTNVVATTAFAANTPTTSTAGQVISPQAEQSEWHYRTYNGVLQKRLWSVTYSKWLTDWMKA